MPSFIQGPYRLHRSLLDDALRGGECLPMNPARGRAPRKRQSRGRTCGCTHPTQVRSILTPKGFFLCRLHKLAPDTATSHAGAENAIPRFCADVAKPCSFSANASYIFRAITNLIVAARYFRIPEILSALSFPQVWGPAREALRRRIYLLQSTRRS